MANQTTEVGVPEIPIAPMMGMMLMFVMLAMVSQMFQAPSGGGPPGSKLDISDGQPFGGTLSFQHQGPGGIFKIGFYCDVQGQHVWAGPVDIELPYDANWRAYSVDVQGVYSSYGLENCRLVNTVKRITDEQEDTTFLEDGDEECYHNVA